MIRPDTVAATRCRWLAGLGAAALAVVISGCDAPAHAALLKCSGTDSAYANMRHDCTLTIEKFDRQTSTSIKINTKRRMAFVKTHFTVQQGTVRIVVKGSAGSETEILASPGKPGIMEGTVRLNRQNNGFNLHFHRMGDAEVVGLAGQLSYEAR